MTTHNIADDLLIYCDLALMSVQKLGQVVDHLDDTQIAQRLLMMMMIKKRMMLVMRKGVEIGFVDEHGTTGEEGDNANDAVYGGGAHEYIFRTCAGCASSTRSITSQASGAREGVE